MDTAQGTPIRLSSEPGDEQKLVCTPDKTRIAYQRNFFGPDKILWKAADGTANEEELTHGDHSRYPSSFSPDGRILAFVDRHPQTQNDSG
jgi:hypothetical protein